MQKVKEIIQELRDIANYKSQIKLLNKRIEELNNKLINSTCNHKLIYKCLKTGLYNVKFYENESIYTDKQ